MQKVATPRELQAELQGLITFVQSSEKPAREVIASKLRTLADRVAGEWPPTGFEFFRELDKKSSRDWTMGKDGRDIVFTYHREPVAHLTFLKAEDKPPPSKYEWEFEAGFTLGGDPNVETGGGTVKSVGEALSAMGKMSRLHKKLR